MSDLTDALVQENESLKQRNDRQVASLAGLAVDLHRRNTLVEMLIEFIAERGRQRA